MSSPEEQINAAQAALADAEKASRAKYDALAKGAATLRDDAYRQADTQYDTLVSVATGQRDQAKLNAKAIHVAKIEWYWQTHQDEISDAHNAYNAVLAQVRASASDEEIGPDVMG